MPEPKGADESGRLSALYRYALLDSDREDTFDDLVAMGARFFDVPYAVISLIDRDRIWFKSRFGIDDPEVTRTPGLCATAIEKTDIYHLENAILDPIAKDHPLVSPPNGIRFYAGAPLCSHDGYNIGTICVMGHEPRTISENDRGFLESLARLTMNEIERRRAQSELESMNLELDARVRVRTRELDGVIRDLKNEARERSVATAALLASEEQQRRIAELASDFYFEVEFEPGQPPKLEWTTGPVTEITGWSREELDLENWARYVHADDRARLPTLFQAVSTAGRGEAEYRFRCKDGSYRWIRLALSASARKGNPNAARFLASVKDIHSLRCAEDLAAERSRDLEQSRSQLHETRRLAWLGTVAAGMAHQINNPVGSILAASEFALLCGDSEEGRQSWEGTFRDIREEALRCGKIVRGILRFARQESTPKVESELIEVVEAATRFAEGYAHEHGRKLALEVAPDADRIRVRLSRVEIEEVLVNLIRNAIESGPLRPVEVHVSKDADYATIVVRDDGCGIPVELTSRVLDPFFTTRLEEGGTGLGLSIASGIIADHSGTLEIDSSPRKGTAVTVRLPLAR